MMSSSDKKVLIVCWSFPPNPGIGGRRWAKFAKYLLRNGYEVHVIKSKKLESDTSIWDSDTKHSNLFVHEVQPHFLSIWIQRGDSFLAKIQHRIAKYWLQIKSKGTIYDSSLGVQKEFQNLLSQLIRKENFSKVIVTGAPFNLFYYTAEVLKNYPNIISIADYRDPWISAENYGMKALNPERMAYEKQKQNTVFDTFSYVSAPGEYMLHEIQETYSGKHKPKAKFVSVAHAYDEDDFKNITDPIAPNKQSSTIHIVYGGCLYLGTESYLKALSDAVLQYNQKKDSSKIKVSIFTPAPHTFKNNLPGLSIQLPIGKEIIEVQKHADILIVLGAEHNKDFKTTKYYEYLPLKKPMLYVGPKGSVAKSILNEKRGFVFDSYTSLVEAIENLSHFQTTADIENDSYRNRTNEIIQLLENPQP